MGNHDPLLARIERLLATMLTPDPPEGWEDRVLEAIEAEVQRKRDRVGEFLTAYEEYLDGKRAYADLPTYRVSPEEADYIARGLCYGSAARRSRSRSRSRR
jgi:hypothetical protein